MASRLERGLRILRCLQQGVNYDAMKLAAEMNVTRRTIFRDIALLKKVGIPIRFDVESGHYALEFLDAGDADAEDSPARGIDLNDLHQLLNTVIDDTNSDESIRKIASVLRGVSPQFDTSDQSANPGLSEVWSEEKQSDSGVDPGVMSGELRPLPEPLDSFCQAIAGGEPICVYEQSKGSAGRWIRFIPTKLTFDRDDWRVYGATLSSQPISVLVRDIHIMSDADDSAPGESTPQQETCK